MRVIDDLQAVLKQLSQTKTRLARESYLDEDDIGLSFTRCLLVLNKIDLPEAEERLALLKEFCPTSLMSSRLRNSSSRARAAAQRDFSALMWLG